MRIPFTSFFLHQGVQEHNLCFRFSQEFPLSLSLIALFTHFSAEALTQAHTPAPAPAHSIYYWYAISFFSATHPHSLNAPVL